MLIKSLFSALAVAGVLTLTSCASSTTTALTESASKQTGPLGWAALAQGEVSREAGVLGSRICFTNATSLPMTAAPSQQVNGKNADHIVGATGALSDTAEQCYAGWRSYLLNVWQGSSDNGAWANLQVDVVLSIGIDGNYNALSFRAINQDYGAPLLNWTENPDIKGGWHGKKLAINGSYEATAAGHTFTVTRLNDSEFYKEYVVRFTK